MAIKSFKHKDKRTHTPSTEEAGMEQVNPVVKGKEYFEVPKASEFERGRDPELIWKNKYGNDDREELLKVDIRSLYRHEHISPELLIQQLYKVKENKDQQMDLFRMFGNNFEMEELEKPTSYYTHQDGWSNRLIQGDSLLVMTSLLEREGMAGKVQTIYMDPPYGIKYGSNWQMKLNNRTMTSGEKDDELSSEPEQIKAFRDTWELGIHSYLSYLRDRLLVAQQLLSDRGSIFLQISEVNLHLVRNVLDEVFGSENFVSVITVIKRSPQPDVVLPAIADYILWYARKKENVKFNQLYLEKTIGEEGASGYDYVIYPDGSNRKAKPEEIQNPSSLPKGAEFFAKGDLTSSHFYNSPPFEFNGKIFDTGKRYWSTSIKGLKKLADLKRIVDNGKSISYVRKFNDFPIRLIGNVWTDTNSGFMANKVYVVQTLNKVIERCLLMTTDPGDLVLDPTCGSGTTAFVAEQWGRRWITTDTSRIALNIAKQRLMTALFPYYYLYDEVNSEYLFDKENNKYKIKLSYNGKNGHSDIRNGFVYEKVPHITLKSLANDEPAEDETLYDKPSEDKKRIRVTGPFTVETLQNFEPTTPEAMDAPAHGAGDSAEELERFENRIFEHLKSAGIKNGIKNEQAVFTRIDRLSNTYLHAEGFYPGAKGEKKAFIHIGPRFGTVSKQAVNEAVKECRLRGGADWLIILGFSFESNIGNTTETQSAGTFEVTKVRMHDDLLQEGLLKKDRKAASFVTIGEPELEVHQDKKNKTVQVEILGLDIYDPIKDTINARNREDIAYWMVDDDYDGSNFIVKQVFFCGGDDEFDKWKKALEKTIKVEIDDEAFARLYGHISHPIEHKKGKKIAVRVISQFGEESTKVVEV